MSYEAVANRLPDLSPPRSIALPDGSVDRHGEVHDPGGRVRHRERFGERVASGEKSFRFEPQGTTAGGMAVNMAQQVAALGGEVTLYGHCDAPEFAFPFETVSLGDPARVTVCRFEDGDLMFAEESTDIRTCDARRLREVGVFEESPDLICVGNWASVPGLSSILRAFADGDTGDGLLVLDTGPVSGAGEPRMEALRDALRELADSRPVVVSANRSETETVATGLDLGTDVTALLPDLRAELGVEAYVLHEEPTAMAATEGGTTRVENLETVDPNTNTGGGDRFTAALGCALGADWPMPQALALGNACASYHIETAENGTREDVARFIRDRR